MWFSKNVEHHKHLGINISRNLPWDEHINTVINKSNKKIGLIWRLSLKVPRSCLTNIYTYYIRPFLEYGCVLYDNCTKHLSDRLENVQRRAAIACTRAFSRANILAELGWDRLDARRNYYKLCLFHKIINGQTQPYLRTLVPARHAQLSSHNLRNRNQLIVPFARLSSYSKSFIPSTTQLWNNLPTTLTSIGSSSSFKRRLKMNLQSKPNQIHQSGMGSAFINLSRIRMGLSGLRSQLYDHGIILNNYCIHCPNTRNADTPMHYFVKCPRFSVQRELYFSELRLIYPDLINNLDDHRWKHKLVHNIVHGDEELSANLNQNMMNATTSFITDTKRF